MKDGMISGVTFSCVVNGLTWFTRNFDAVTMSKQIKECFDKLIYELCSFRTETPRTNFTVSFILDGVRVQDITVDATTLRNRAIPHLEVLLDWFLAELQEADCDFIDLDRDLGARVKSFNDDFYLAGKPVKHFFKFHDGQLYIFGHLLDHRISKEAEGVYSLFDGPDRRICVATPPIEARVVKEVMSEENMLRLSGFLLMKLLARVPSLAYDVDKNAGLSVNDVAVLNEFVFTCPIVSFHDSKVSNMCLDPEPLFIDAANPVSLNISADGKNICVKLVEEEISLPISVD